MSEAKATIDKLSEDFDRSIIRMKPGSNKRPAMPYVSHGSVTKRLNAVAPGWSSRVVEVHSYVKPASGLLECAAVTLELTIPGVGSRQEVGTANQPRNFGDDLKNAMSDALKRCAMRFGVAIDLWESADEADEDAYPAQDTPRAAQTQQRPAQRPRQAPDAGDPPPPPPQVGPVYTAAEFKFVTQAAWAIRLKHDYERAFVYVRGARDYLTADQYDDMKEELKRLKAGTPEGAQTA